MDKIVANIYETTDYGKFVVLKENRDVTEARKKKVRRSIDEIGVLFGEPLVVNEEFEVGDGQARLEVCKERGLPVYYVVQPGIGVKEIAILNSASTNWGMMDFVNSYSEQGIESYVYLSELLNRFGKGHLSFAVVVAVTQDTMNATGNSAGRTIKSGEFSINKDDKKEIESTLEFLMSVESDAKKIGGNRDYFFLALAWSHRHTEAEQERLRSAARNCVVDKDGRKNAVSTVEQALSLVEEAYNKGKRSNRIYFTSEYKEYNIKKIASYRKRWADKK